MKGKEKAETNEDGLIVTPYFAAVIDDVTAKSDFAFEGKKSGRLAMELTGETIRNFPKNIQAEESIKK